jgi:hypothetical protein
VVAPSSWSPCCRHVVVVVVVVANAPRVVTPVTASGASCVTYDVVDRYMY